jgi:hypothetical protein
MSYKAAARIVVAPLFKKGQIWLMQDKQLLIRHMGKRLVEFKIVRTSEGMQGRRTAPSSLETVEIVWNYLQTQKAVLQPPAIAKVV